MLLQKMFMQKVATQRTKPSSLVRQPEFAATSIDLQFFLHLEELCPWRLSHTELLSIVVPSIHSIIKCSVSPWRLSRCLLAANAAACFLTLWLLVEVTFMKLNGYFNLRKWSADTPDALEKKIVWFLFLLFDSLLERMVFFLWRIEEDTFDFHFLQCKCH